MFHIMKDRFKITPYLINLNLKQDYPDSPNYPITSLRRNYAKRPGNTRTGIRQPGAQALATPAYLQQSY
jgi:hypothetical protein